MTDRALPLIVALLLAATIGASPCAAAQEQVTAVGSDGELYTVQTGSYGALFPEWNLAAPESSVLRLEVIHPDRTRDRLVVPQTETDDVEDSVSLVYDDGSETLFILWQTKFNVVHSSLNLVSYQDGVWSPVIEIWGSPFGWKTAPQLAVTRDQFVTEDGNDDRVEWARTVVHVIWSEEGAYGPDVLYSPIILLDGEFIGRSPVYRLADLADLPADGPVGSIAPALAEAPRIQAGRNAQTVVVGLTDPRTGRLVTLEIETLPGEIAHLGERLRRQIIEIGHASHTPPEAFADELRRQIIEIGQRIDIHPGVAAYAADVVGQEVQSTGGRDPMDVLAERLRRQIIEIGARMTGRGVDRTLAKTGYHVLEVDPHASLDTGAVEPETNLVRVSTTSSRLAPQIPDAAEALSLYLSRSGENVIVAWPEEDRLAYHESLGDGWSETLGIAVEADGVSSIERAQKMLQQRAESRREAFD